MTDWQWPSGDGYQYGGSRDYHELVRVHPRDFTYRTYRLSEELADRLRATAKAHQVGVSDLVRYLLTVALDQIDAGTLTIPTRPVGLRVIDYDR